MYDYTLRKTVEKIFSKLAAKNRDSWNESTIRSKKLDRTRLEQHVSGLCRDKVAIG